MPIVRQSGWQLRTGSSWTRGTWSSICKERPHLTDRINPVRDCCQICWRRIKPDEQSQTGLVPIYRNNCFTFPCYPWFFSLPRLLSCSSIANNGPRVRLYGFRVLATEVYKSSDSLAHSSHYTSHYFNVASSAQKVLTKEQKWYRQPWPFFQYLYWINWVTGKDPTGWHSLS
jgi:hypothetical protein